MDSVSRRSLLRRGNNEGNAHVSWFTSKPASILEAANEMKPGGVAAQRRGTCCRNRCV